MTVNVQMDASKVIAELKTIVGNIKKETRIVSWKVAGTAVREIAKDVTQELNTAQKVVKKQLVKKRIPPTGAQVALARSSRIPLRDFGARQTKAGVSYKLSKSKGRKVVPGAFMGPRPGVVHPKWRGRVFNRDDLTWLGPKQRGPIHQLYGLSPWGVFVKRKRVKPMKRLLAAELFKQAKERLRYQRLKQSGEI